MLLPISFTHVLKQFRPWNYTPDCTQSERDKSREEKVIKENGRLICHIRECKNSIGFSHLQGCFKDQEVAVKVFHQHQAPKRDECLMAMERSGIGHYTNCHPPNRTNELAQRLEDKVESEQRKVNKKSVHEHMMGNLMRQKFEMLSRNRLS